MKFTVNREKLQKALQRVGSIIGSRSMFPVLGNVLIQAEENLLTLTTTDLEIRISTTLEAAVEVPGVSTAPARKLASLVGCFVGSDVLFDIDEKDHIKLKCGTSHFTLLGLAAAAALLPGIGQRVHDSLGLLSGQAQATDAALAGRGRVWSGALCMIGEHPINGVGVRGFRHAWAQCDPAPQLPPAWGQVPALHAHQLLLEIASETGLLGLVLWLAGAAAGIRAWLFAAPAARARSLPAAIAIAVALFPLNTHLAVYSAFWGGITLLLAALYVGALQARD